jgi:hypothetical protein
VSALAAPWTDGEQANGGFVSNLIDFLQRLGQGTELHHAPRTELALALAGAGIDPALRAALLGTGQRKLGILPGAQTNVCAITAPNKKEEDEEDEDDFEDDEDDEDEDEEDLEDDEGDYEDEEDYEDDEDYDDEEEEEEEEENSLTPHRSPLRRVG